MPLLPLTVVNHHSAIKRFHCNSAYPEQRFSSLPFISHGTAVHLRFAIA